MKRCVEGHVGGNGSDYRNMVLIGLKGCFPYSMGVFIGEGTRVGRVWGEKSTFIRM